MSERRLTYYLAGIAFLVFLLVLAAYLGGAYLGRGAGENAWARQNERLLVALPLYPGVVRARDPYSTGEPDPNARHKTASGGPFRGYWTTHTFTLPPGSRPDLVLSFYGRRLTGWIAQPTPAGSNCESSYRRGRALLDVKACDNRLALSLNYREYGA